MDSFRLETISELHPLATQFFVPFAIARLQEYSAGNEAELTIELRNIDDETTNERQLRLIWDADSIPTMPLAIQENPLTEWAALGVASGNIWYYAGLRLHSVAAAGDSFDYWVKREDQEFGLEISGTQTTDLEQRHREKLLQLRSNPYEMDGFTVVVGFAARRVIFLFHRFEEKIS